MCVFWKRTRRLGTGEGGKRGLFALQVEFLSVVLNERQGEILFKSVKLIKLNFVC